MITSGRYFSQNANLKFYMDHFSMEKNEAEKRIQNTPLHDKNENS